MRIAFLGAGAINFGGPEGPWDHATRLEKIPGVEVVAIVDPWCDRAAEVLQKRKSSSFGDVYKTCQLFSSLNDLLSSKVQVDAVILGTPPHTRGSFEKDKDIELQLVKAGIHVFCEKPVTALLPEEFKAYSQAVTEAVKEKNVVFSVGYMFRYHEGVRKMKELIQEHGGKVMSLEARYYFAYRENSNPNWWNVSKSGGPIVEQATHFCDIARFLAGDINESTIKTTCLRVEDEGGAGVIASPQFEQELNSENRAPRVTMAHWRFKEGGLGSLTHTIALHGGKYETTIDVQLDGLRLTLLEVYHPECTLRVRDSSSENGTTFLFGHADPYEEELKAFVKAAEMKDDSLIQSSYEDAAKTFNMTWAIRRAE